MPTSAIAVLNYRRASVLQVFIESLQKHCSHYPIAVFEDCATFDGAAAYLTKDATHQGYDEELDSDFYLRPDGIQVYLGRRNEGVAGNSNKALKWFERGKWEHLCLCNDDLEALGDFPAYYLGAHKKLGVGLWCFYDSTLPDYVGPIARAQGYKVKMMPRMVGAMMSITKQLHSAIGYFSAVWARFGQEHCAYNNRARLMGFCSLNGQAQLCLDLEQTVLKSQPTPSSILPYEKPTLDREAFDDINKDAALYAWEHLYKPYRLPHPAYADNTGAPEFGLSVHDLDRLGYVFVADRSL